MKVHQLTRGFWEHEPSLTLGCKRLRPLAPKLITSFTSGSHDSSSVITRNTTSSLDIKSFIRADSGPRRSSSNIDQKKRHSIQVEAQAGGTRWNPTQEQIGILEMLYKGGMRTPNAQQVKQITDQLSKYGKIEGKNVFYWFQNHKARERQKQKRSSLGLTPSPRTPAPPVSSIHMDTNGGVERSEEDNNYYYKRKYRSWGAGETGFQEGINMLNRSSSSTSSSSEEEKGDKTLELFPLHPESR